MYTQCPDCNTAFRVTAEVLKQAAGKVRCGGCGNAFNALAYLSEQKPEAKPSETPEPALPELKPDTPDDGSTDGLPRSISAEQSAALLKTLDQLAGSDIRIEDTGVEWRVLDDDEQEDVRDVFESPGLTELDAELDADAGEAVLDEILEEAPTPVDEFLTQTPNDVEAGEIFEEADEPEEPIEVRTSVDELRFDDNTPLPDDFDFDEPPAEERAEAPLEVQAEELPEAEEPEFEEPQHLQVDLAFGDSDEWESLLDEVVADTQPDPEAVPVEDEDAEAPLEAQSEEQAEPGEPLDMDTQFAIQAEAMGIDLSGIHETDEDEELEEELSDVDLDELLESETEEPAEATEETPLEAQDADDESDELVESLEFDLAEADAAIDASTSGEFEVLDIVEDEIEGELEDEIEVQPLSEEEQTINMMIDQDLMAIAVEDEDGFASTIVKGGIEEILEEERQAEAAAAIKSQWPAEALSDDEDAPQIETVIMEGEFVRTELEDEKQTAEATLDELLDPVRADTRDESGKGVRGGRRKTDPPSWGLIAAAVFLGLLLAIQLLHQSRESLATNPLFNKTFGPFYRMIGRPLTPTWDVSGWRFEWSAGDFDESGETLTIVSRVGNMSTGALPYPLISVALTDRFEEVIGNKVLEPNEYLASDLDPRKPVAPSNKFEAAITIQTPSAEITGFKLNVCYRIEGEQLRCNMQDFK